MLVVDGTQLTKKSFASIQSLPIISCGNGSSIAVTAQQLKQQQQTVTRLEHRASFSYILCYVRLGVKIQYVMNYPYHSIVSTSQLRIPSKYFILYSYDRGNHICIGYYFTSLKNVPMTLSFNVVSDTASVSLIMTNLYYCMKRYSMIKYTNIQYDTKQYIPH